MIINYGSIETRHCVFFGDAITDYNAAQLLSMDFIGIGKSMISFLEKRKVIG
jgi:hypothetical protein